ncbi:hypothetical protein PTKIN_Ptkin06aG0080600 [Pterospermum kingtungense]
MWFHRQNKVVKFRLRCTQALNYRSLCNWISSSVDCGVQHLELSISSDNRAYSPSNLPNSVIRCKTLVSMKIDLDMMAFNVPENTNFPSLKHLHIKQARFGDNVSVDRLFSSCIHLKEMIFDNCEFSNISRLSISLNFRKVLNVTMIPMANCRGDLNIFLDTHLLGYLKYSCVSASGYSFRNMNSIEVVDINVVRMNHYENRHDDSTALFHGIRNVHSLILSVTTLEV